MKKIYLAIPYSKFNTERSYQIANKVASDLLKQGHFVFSPITQSHPLSIVHGLPENFPFWEALDKCFIDWADEVVVINVGEEHLKKSTGVQAEIKYAKETNTTVSFIEWTKKDTLALYEEQTKSTIVKLFSELEKDFEKYTKFLKKLTQ